MLAWFLTWVLLLLLLCCRLLSSILLLRYFLKRILSFWLLMCMSWLLRVDPSFFVISLFFNGKDLLKMRSSCWKKILCASSVLRFCRTLVQSWPRRVGGQNFQCSYQKNVVGSLLGLSFTGWWGLSGKATAKRQWSDIKVSITYALIFCSFVSMLSITVFDVCVTRVRESPAGHPRMACGWILLVLMGLPIFFLDSWNCLRKNNYINDQF